MSRADTRLRTTVAKLVIHMTKFTISSKAQTRNQLVVSKLLAGRLIKACPSLVVLFG